MNQLYCTVHNRHRHVVIVQHRCYSLILVAGCHGNVRGATAAIRANTAGPQGPGVTPYAGSRVPLAAVGQVVTEVVGEDEVDPGVGAAVQTGQ